jgi:hypothetical protein
MQKLNSIHRHADVPMVDVAVYQYHADIVEPDGARRRFEVMVLDSSNPQHQSYQTFTSELLITEVGDAESGPKLEVDHGDPYAFQAMGRWEDEQAASMLEVVIGSFLEDEAAEDYSHVIARDVKDMRSIIDALKGMIDMFERHIAGREGPDDAAQRYDRARDALAPDAARQAALDAATAGNTRIYCSICGKPARPGQYVAVAGGYWCGSCHKAETKRQAGLDAAAAAKAKARK